MFLQQVKADEQVNRKILDLMEFKKKKPFFKRPVRITLGYPMNCTYYIVKNVVYMGKQILALKQEMETNHIVLVEGKIENGQLTCISMLSEECLGDVSRMLEGAI
ncbi:hypothetical protein V7182_18105 [Neobacillus drentensis]|jgi:hypothetical protein|uniref:hypothetical protein n=1 Tax=Bacillaceae TaxID=186817 RepID=UPI002859499A|nr:hypothetical protein [Bacillus sp. SLBN-46]MDR6123756.1 hypothetical protein [Bacillus sp. SLBN-46]